MKEASVVWKEGMRFAGTATSGHELVLDASEQNGGRNAGFRPMELLLVGLAGCTAMDVISILQKKRQNVTGLEVKASGDRADEHPRVFTNIHLEYIVRGHNLNPNAVARAIELSETTYCSAQAQLRPGVPMTNSFRIVEEEPEKVQG